MKKKKVIVTIIAAALILCLAIGGTIAWLTAKTDPVTNTFTVGDINITLDESDDLDLKMVPGKEITKDPKVTVLENSEDCWLFVKIDKSSNFDAFMTYGIADGWTQLGTEETYPGVYYREVSSITSEKEFPVLADNKVTVKGEEVTKEMLSALTPENYPTLTFKAYACQRASFDYPSDAWEKVRD
ncbi:MAG: CalY family protein [Lachnospiraceae bacterium]|nr:CalY family protein [Lachnospiraceae bacterium]